jgi:hypothetical protein
MSLHIGSKVQDSIIGHIGAYRSRSRQTAEGGIIREAMTSANRARALTCAAFLLVGTTQAQSPGLAANSSSAPRPQADLAQLMKGIVYPSSNVFFAAQTDDPAELKPDSKPSVSPNLLTSTFGKWEAVENSALALAESASLLTVPRRKCSNGVDVPLKNADWAKFVNELRDAGVIAYKAAQSKNQDNIIQAADAVTTACSNCHARYRDRTNRCR